MGRAVWPAIGAEAFTWKLAAGTWLFAADGLAMLHVSQDPELL